MIVLSLGAGAQSRPARPEVDVSDLLDRRTPLPEALGQIEKQLLVEALRRGEGLELAAAGTLGLDLETLLAKLRRYGLGPERRMRVSPST